jgi:menaquinone-dependent protoporphyrinogen oxidase
MASVLVVFESKYGQSEKIAARAVALARKRGHSATMVHARLALEATLDDHDLVLIVAPVYFGKHGKEATAFVTKRRPSLDRLRCAFVSVSGAAGDVSPARQAEAKERVKKFLAETGLRPLVAITAGGATAYPRYNVFLRMVIKWISKKHGGPTDTSKTHESTDWPAFERAVGGLLDELGSPVAQYSSAPL